MSNDDHEPISPARDDAGTIAEQLARDLYDEVRQNNHATGGLPDLDGAGTVRTVLDDLSVAAYSLDQTIEQLNDFVLHEEAAGRLTHGHDEPTVRNLHECGQALAIARHHSSGLHAALSEAQSAINAVPTGACGADVKSAAETAAEDFPVPLGEVSSAFPSPDRPPPHSATASRPARLEA
ncbi:hypothetical protein [Spirillospora sp. NBC_01491]|uniref:hypothetical protein n=1 Tax=Spirillospora sp. NBC_01491 TaxID=2976007 RepID=UPI002E380BE0|nr:hypothetical protein [Spirillospora sp. NBC_01491]